MDGMVDIQLISVLGTLLVTLIGTILTYFNAKENRKVKKQNDAQKEINRLESELNLAKSEMDEAHHALTRSNSEHIAGLIVDQKEKERFYKEIHKAEQAAESYRVKRENVRLQRERIWEESQ